MMNGRKVKGEKENVVKNKKENKGGRRGGKENSEKSEK